MCPSEKLPQRVPRLRVGKVWTEKIQPICEAFHQSIWIVLTDMQSKFFKDFRYGSLQHECAYKSRSILNLRVFEMYAALSIR